MIDKEFRRLRRIELIDVIYKLQNSEEQLQAEIASLKQQMANRELKLSKAGSIAGAAMSLNGVFEAAQATADQYVTEVQKLHADTENQIAQMLSNAKTRAAEIVLAASVSEMPCSLRQLLKQMLCLRMRKQKFLRKSSVTIRRRRLIRSFDA